MENHLIFRAHSWHDQRRKNHPPALQKAPLSRPPPPYHHSPSSMKKHAVIYRMVTPRPPVPLGHQGQGSLKRSGYEVEDHQLPTMEANEAYKRETGVDETPQVFIEGKRFNYDALREHLGKGPDPKTDKTYQPVIAVFAVTFALALTTCWAQRGELVPVRVAELFIAFSMCVLGILKLQDLLSFATGFVQYDLIARRWVPYAYIYPFVEAGAGVLMIAGLLTWIAAPAALVVSTLGAISIIKAAYIEKRDVNCACVGGGSQVPLGFISLTENLLMMAMSAWMLWKATQVL
jgi:uncharacterized membrane protein YphA (DoxX/SURF4 family)/glutaredoxin